MEKMLKTTAKDRVTKIAEHVNGGCGIYHERRVDYA